jgi:hydrogenase maturation protease
MNHRIGSDDVPRAMATPTSAGTCVVGLGGLFGDDAVGWCVVDRLRALVTSDQHVRIRLETASTPADLLGLVNNQQRLILVDASRGLGAVGRVARLRWPSSQIAGARHGWGHNVTLDDALHILTRLETFPGMCEIWCIEGERFELGRPLSPAVELAAAQVAAEILHGLGELTVREPQGAREYARSLSPFG